MPRYWPTARAKSAALTTTTASSATGATGCFYAKCVDLDSTPANEWFCARCAEHGVTNAGGGVAQRRAAKRKKANDEKRRANPFFMTPDERRVAAETEAKQALMRDLEAVKQTDAALSTGKKVHHFFAMQKEKAAAAKESGASAASLNPLGLYVLPAPIERAMPPVHITPPIDPTVAEDEAVGRNALASVAGPPRKITREGRFNPSPDATLDSIRRALAPAAVDTEEEQEEEDPGGEEGVDLEEAEDAYLTDAARYVLASEGRWNAGAIVSGELASARGELRARLASLRARGAARAAGRDGSSSTDDSRLDRSTPFDRSRRRRRCPVDGRVRAGRHGSAGVRRRRGSRGSRLARRVVVADFRRGGGDGCETAQGQGKGGKKAAGRGSGGRRDGERGSERRRYERRGVRRVGRRDEREPRNVRAPGDQERRPSRERSFAVRARRFGQDFGRVRRGWRSLGSRCSRLTPRASAAGSRCSASLARRRSRDESAEGATSRKNGAPAASGGFFGKKPAPAAATTSAPAKDTAKKDAKETARNTLILFEEVDVLRGEDRGFMAALAQLIAGAKRPIVLTSNSPSLPSLIDAPLPAGTSGDGLRLARVRFRSPSPADAAVYASLVAAAEGKRVSPGEVASAARLADAGDVRRALLSAQFAASSPAAEMTPTTDPWHDQVAIDGGGRGARVRHQRRRGRRGRADRAGGPARRRRRRLSRPARATMCYEPRSRSEPNRGARDGAPGGGGGRAQARGGCRRRRRRQG